MQKSITTRLRFYLGMFETPIFRIVLFVWAGTGAYDLILSEWLPEEISKSFPRVWQVVAMTMGFLPLYAWITAGAVLIAVAALEYGFREARRSLPESDRIEIDAILEWTRTNFDAPYRLIGECMMAVNGNTPWVHYPQGKIYTKDGARKMTSNSPSSAIIGCSSVKEALSLLIQMFDKYAETAENIHMHERLGCSPVTQFTAYHAWRRANAEFVKSYRDLISKAKYARLYNEAPILLKDDAISGIWPAMLP